MLDIVRPIDRCPHCSEPVMPFEPRERYANDPRWYHMECFARPVLGSVAHIEERCSCFVPGATEGDDPALTPRQAAQAAIDAYRRKHRALALRELKEK